MDMKITPGQKELSRYVNDNLLDITLRPIPDVDYIEFVSKGKVLRHIAKVYQEMSNVDDSYNYNYDELKEMFMSYREFYLSREPFEAFHFLPHYFKGAYFALLEDKVSAEDTLEWCMRLCDGTWLRPLVREMVKSNRFPELKAFYTYGKEYVDRTEDWVANGSLYEYTKLGGADDYLCQSKFEHAQKKYKNALEMLADEGGKL